MDLWLGRPTCYDTEQGEGRLFSVSTRLIVLQYICVKAICRPDTWGGFSRLFRIIKKTDPQPAAGGPFCVELNLTSLKIKVSRLFKRDTLILANPSMNPLM